MNKVVTHLSVKNKWDHLRSQWKVWKRLFEHETGLGYDPDTWKIDASDGWNVPKQNRFVKKSPVDVDPMDVEWSLLLRAGPKMNKEKGLTRNVQLFKGIHKKHAVTEVQVVMDMVLSLPRVQSSDRLHVFSAFFFMENENAMHMFAANRHDKSF
nr:hypothetical protein CFP56_76723 [Quercus suber]